MTSGLSFALPQLIGGTGEPVSDSTHIILVSCIPPRQDEVQVVHPASLHS